MRTDVRKVSSSLIICSLILALPVLAAAAEHASEDAGSVVAFSYKVTVKPGHVMEFEKALTQHNELHAEAGDPWARDVWTEVVGDTVGAYYIRTCCYDWPEFDEEMQIEGDREHIMTKLDPHVTSVEGSITEWMPDMSRWPEEGRPKMVELVSFDLDPGRMSGFFHAISTAHEVIGEKQMDWRYAWGRIAAGGTGEDVVLAMWRDGWADFAPEEPGLWDMMEEIHGEAEEHRLRGMISDAILSESSRVVMFRSDLSYEPADN